MNTKHAIALSTAVLAVLGTAATHAETYEGVHAPVAAVSRADVRTEAAAAARSGNVYSDADAEGVATVSSTRERSAVRAEGVATAHDSLQSLDQRAFYRDEVPSAYSKPAVSFARQAAL